jgi:hypothetical protein
MHGISCSSMEWNLFGSSVYYLILYVHFGIPGKAHVKVNCYCTRCVQEMIGWRSVQIV